MSMDNLSEATPQKKIRAPLPEASNTNVEGLGLMKPSSSYDSRPILVYVNRVVVRS